MGICMRQEQEKLEGVTRREALKIGVGVLASVMFGKYLLLDGTARAENRSRKNGNGENGEKMKTIPVEDMKRWDRETKPYRHAPDTLDEEMFTTSLKFRVGDALVLAVAIIYFNNKKKSGVSLTFKRDGDEKESSEKGVKINNFLEFYKEKTGRETKSLRLVVEKGNDPEQGVYAQIWLVPNGDIKSGVPVLPGVAYYNGNVGGEDKPVIIASAK